MVTSGKMGNIGMKNPLTIRERAQKVQGVPFELFRAIGDFLGGCLLPMGKIYLNTYSYAV